MEIGSYNTLRVVKRVEFGLYLDGEELGEILLPNRYVPDNAQIDDFLEVFLYHDNQGRVIATTAHPLAVVGDFTALQVKTVGSFGAFLEWGIMKDLLLPFSEQNREVKEGDAVFVHVYLDNVTHRVVASAKWEKFLDKEAVPTFKEGDAVQVKVAAFTQLGIKVLIENQFIGLLYRNEVFQRLQLGQELTAHIRRIRPDGKIDLRLQQSGYQAIEGEAKRLMHLLEDNDGFLPTTDKSPANFIYDTCGMSKKTYKKAVGDLYRHRLIVLEPNGIRLIQK